MIKNILFLFTFLLLLPGFLRAQNVPVANFTASTDSICDNVLTDNFIDISSNHPTSWKWYFQGATPDTSTLQNPANIVYHGYGCYNVTEVVKNNNGSDSITRGNYICLDEMPKIIITGGDVCQGGLDTITITAIGGSHYRWSTGDTSSSIILNVPGIVNITYSIGLTSGACHEDTSVTIRVDTMPYFMFAGDTSICAGDSTVIYALPQLGHSNYGYTYLWSTGSTADSIIVSGKIPGTYVYYLTVSKGACMKDSGQIAVKVHECTGVENYTTSSGLQIFPNPVSKQLSISGGGIIEKNATLSILDITGRTLINEKINSSLSQLNVDVSSLSPGIYFIKFQTDKGILVRKFVKD